MEFDLLRVFIENANRVLSRDQLLTLTRNREWEPFDRSIDIRIARLRRKIEVDPGASPPRSARCAAPATCSSRPEVEDRLREAALAVSSAEGERVYEDLLAALASILGVEFALISVYVEPARKALRTLATIVGGATGRERRVSDRRHALRARAGARLRHLPVGRAGEVPGGRHPAAAGDRGLRGDHAERRGRRADRTAVGDVAPAARATRPSIEAMLKIFGARIAAEIERRRAEQVLRASESQYRAMFDAAADSLVLRDADYRVVDVNPAFLSRTGLPARGPDRHGRADRDSADARASGLFELHKRAIAGEQIQFEAPATAPDGNAGRGRGARRADDAPGPAARALRRPRHHRAQGARRRACAAARSSTAASSTPRPTRWCCATPSSASSTSTPPTRRSAATAARRCWARTELTHARARTGTATGARCTSARWPGESVQLETDALRKDGSRFRIEVHAVPMAYKGKPHVLYIGRDITERKAQEERLRASEEQYRAIFNAIDEALVLRDAEFRIVDVNRAYEAMSGYTRDEVVGVDRPDLQRSRAAAPSGAALHQRALAGEQVQFEVAGPRARTAASSSSTCAWCRSSTAASRTCCRSARKSPRAWPPTPSARSSKRSCARRRRWRRSATSPAASRTTSTTSCRASSAT